MHEVYAKSILTANNGGSKGMNIYRGCSHGCIYCDSRSTCYQMQHPFEDIEVKVNAPQLLETELRRKRKKCMIGTGAMCDPYLHIEKDLKLTRRCLELIDEYGFGLTILTKSDMILRDLELLKSISRKAKCVVQMTLTTYDEDLCSILEPNVCTTKRRFEVLEIMRDEGIPTVCWMTPTLPFINDTEENVRGILDYCARAKVYGVLYFDAGMTLRDGDRQYYYYQLDRYFPGLKDKYIQTYGSDYILSSPDRVRLNALIQKICHAQGMVCDTEALFNYMRTFEDGFAGKQLTIFDI